MTEHEHARGHWVRVHVYHVIRGEMGFEMKYTMKYTDSDGITWVKLTEWASVNDITQNHIRAIRKTVRDALDNDGTFDDTMINRIMGTYVVNIDANIDHIIVEYGSNGSTRTRRVDDPDALRFVCYASWDSIRTALTTVNIRIWTSRYDAWVVLDNTHNRIEIRNDDNVLLGWVDDDNKRHIVNHDDDNTTA